jgi:hypothetical protein
VSNMTENIDLDLEDLMELMKYSFLRLDGA